MARIVVLSIPFVDHGRRGACHRQWRLRTSGSMSSLSAGRRPTALFLHKPLFLEYPTDDVVSPACIAPSVRTQLLGKLNRSDVRLIVSGHLHQHRDREVGGHRHLWTPAVAFAAPQALGGDGRCGLAVLDFSQNASRSQSNGHRRKSEPPIRRRPPRRRPSHRSNDWGRSERRHRLFPRPAEPDVAEAGEASEHHRPGRRLGGRRRRRAPL